MRASNLKILILAVLIAVIGISCIYSSTYQKEGKLWQEIYKRQIVWAIAGIGIFIAMSKFNYRRLWDATFILYAAVIFLLFAVFALGSMPMRAKFLA